MPTVLENWDNLEAVDKQSLLNVNEFFCGLHYMVALAEQTEETLKLADNLLYGTSKVGSLAHGGYTKGESGTTRLIRTVCKSVQERGCEKSGRMAQFATFIKQKQTETETVLIPLAPFIGNCFNILFYNGAGCYYLFDHLNEFFDVVKGENKLLSAVFHDL